MRWIIISLLVIGYAGSVLLSTKVFDDRKDGGKESNGTGNEAAHLFDKVVPLVRFMAIVLLMIYLEIC